MTTHKTFETIMIDALNPLDKKEIEKNIIKTQKAIQIAKHPRTKELLKRNLKGFVRMYTGG